MQLSILIPLSAFIAGSAVAGAVLGRGPRIRSNRAVAGMLACGCGWALAEVMGGISAGAEEAARWLRCHAIFALAIGPLTLLTLTDLRPALRPRLVRLAKLAAGPAFLTGLVCMLTPWFIRGAEPVQWGGWAYRFGPLAPLVLLQEAWLPLLALWHLSHRPVAAEARQGDLPTGPAVGIGLAAPLLVVFATDVLLPFLAIDFPRLGTASIALFGGTIWFYSFRQAEGAITDSGFARAIFDNLPDGMALLERDGRIRAVNGSLARLAGRRRRDLMGHSIDDFLRNTPAELMAGMQESEAVLHAEGRATVPVAVCSTPIRDRQKGVIGAVLIARDLRAVMALRRRVVAAGRLAAVGELAAGIAHEVNNPIAFIQANLNLLRGHYEEIESHIAKHGLQDETLLASFEAGSECIEDSFRSIARVAETVREISGFAHAGGGEPKLCDVNELLEGAARLASLRPAAGVAIERDFGVLPPFLCAEQALKQVFLSLVRRAASAVNSDGRVCLMTRTCVNSIIVVVEDDGERIPDSELERFSVATFGSVAMEWGGLELGICQQMLRQQGGELSVQHRPRGGTRVCVSLTQPETHRTGAGARESGQP